MGSWKIFGVAWYRTGSQDTDLIESNFHPHIIVSSTHATCFFFVEHSFWPRLYNHNILAVTYVVNIYFICIGPTIEEAYE